MTRPEHTRPASPTSPASIRLRIDELVLHGFGPEERYAIGSAVERELTRLLSGRDAASFAKDGWNAHRLDAGTIGRAADGTLGEEIARAVHGALVR